MAKEKDANAPEIVSSDNDDEDDDDLEELMSFCPFSPSPGPKTTPKKEEDNEHAVVTQPEKPEGESDIEKEAAEEAGSVPIPDLVRRTSQLFWHKHTKKGRKVYHPCRICAAEEVVGLALPQTWDQTQKALIQYIKYPTFEDRTLVSLKSLVPYYGEGKDGASEVTTDEHKSSKGWCSKLLSCYLRERGKPKVEKRAEAIFLDRVLENAQKKEQEFKVAQSEAKNDQADPNTEQQTKKSDEATALAQDDAVSFEETSDSDACNSLEDCTELASQRKTEPIRPGDVIEYYTNQFVSGDKRGLRRTVVLSVNPKGVPVLVLDNGECLPPDTQVKRILVFSRGKHCDYERGVYQPIERYQLRKASNPKISGKGSGAAAGFRKEIERVGEILRNNYSKIQAKMEADGTSSFGFMLNNYGKVAGNKGKEETAKEDISKSTTVCESQKTSSAELRKKERKRQRDDTQPQNVDVPNAKRNQQGVSRLSGRRNTSMSFLSEDQLKLAFKVKKFLLKQRFEESADGKINNIDSAALDELSYELNISVYRLEKFLEGDEKRLINKRLHEETEKALRKWLLSQEDGDTICDDIGESLSQAT